MIEELINTSIGMVPSNWEVKRFIKETELLTCGVASTPIYVDAENGVPFLSAQNVRDGKVVLDKFKYISKLHHQELTKNNKPKKGDILYSRVGAKFGEAAVVEHDFEFSVYVSLTHIRVKSTSDSYFIKFLLNSNYVKKLARSSVFQGAGVPNLNVKVVRDFLLAFPPLPEQQKIAEILSTVDAKIDVIDQQITETQALKKGLMQRLLTKGIGHTEFKDSPLGEIPKSWEVIELGELIKLKSGDGLSKSEMIEGYYPVYGGNGITFYHGKFNYKESKLIIGRVGAKCGCIHRTEKFSWITDNALIIDKSLKEHDTFFLEYILNKIDLNQYANKNAQPVISGGKIYPLEIPFPPIQEQQKIAKILSSVDDKLEVLSEKKTHYQELKQGLMQQLLTGKIRVPQLPNENETSAC